MKGPAAAPAPLVPLLLMMLLVLPPASLTACGIADSGPAPAGSPASGLARPEGRQVVAIHVYFYSADGLERVSRSDGDAGDTERAQSAMDLLAEGPNEAERARGLVSFLPDHAPAPLLTSRTTGTAEVTVQSRGIAGRAALRQLVCTAADAVGSVQDTRPENVKVRVRRATGGVLVTETCAL